jgi:hypothetical protein
MEWSVNKLANKQMEIYLMFPFVTLKGSNINSPGFQPRVKNIKGGSFGGFFAL